MHWLELRMPAIVCAFFVLVFAGPIAHAHEGPEFTRLAKPQPVGTPGKIEVIEFFWYGCPHCSALEPLLVAWEKRLPKDVVLRREHIVWPGRKETEVHARLFLTLRAMNLLEKYHVPVFDAIHKAGAKGALRTDAQVLDWAVKAGIDRAKFEAAYKSFGVNAQTARAMDVTFNYDVDGVPSFVVNGKTRATLGAAHSPEKLLQTLDKLIAEERPGKKYQK